MGTKSRAENFKFTKKKLMNKYIPPDECVPEFTALLDCINLAGGSKDKSKCGKLLENLDACFSSFSKKKANLQRMPINYYLKNVIRKLK
mmetsp:Transcript_3107/g.11204  ORF Transcript_3107/g.11204 Transcript_3107/m.11204 type:complete len:89 (-) Transcript_3107:36-302(-)